MPGLTDIEVKPHETGLKIFFHHVGRQVEVVTLEYSEANALYYQMAYFLGPIQPAPTPAPPPPAPGLVLAETIREIMHYNDFTFSEALNIMREVREGEKQNGKTEN